MRAPIELRRVRGAIGCGVAAALCASVGLAQTAANSDVASGASSDQLEEVVITAQKRTERLEDVPVSAAVVSGNALADSNVSDVSDLNKLVPSLNINGTISGRAPLGMRGISSVSNEQAVGVPSGVAIMIDGVPVPPDSFDGNQVEDVQSVEVLKGPQATLGGRTAAAGVINYRTYDPTSTFEGGVSATATTDHELRGSAHVSGPLGEQFEYSLSVYDANRYYPITNEFYGTKSSQRDSGVRAKLLWKINDAITAKLTFHHATVDQHGFNFVYTYLTPGSELLGALPQSELLGPIVPSWRNLRYDSPVNAAGHEQIDNDAQLDLSFDLGGGYTLTSTSAYQHENQRQIQDLFATDVYFFDSLITGMPATTPLPITNPGPPFFDDQQLQEELITQRSEELKLVSPLDRPVSFVAGFFYSDTDVAMNYQRPFLPAALNLPNVEPKTDTYDVYGRATWKILPSTSLIAGLRYNYDRISYTYNEQEYVLSFPTNVYGPFLSSGSSNSSAVVGDVTLRQQFAPDVMGYATYARGYSPKVYNTATILTSDAPLQPVGQEHIDHFEIGTKGSYLDRRLTANISIFDTVYHDYQINGYTLVPGSVSGILNIDAAGEAETRGAEFDSNWLATPLTRLGLSAAYVDAIFKDWKNAPCVPFYPDGVTGTSTNCSFNPGLGFTQNMSGKPMPNAPRWKFYLDAQQRIPLGAAPFELLVDGNWAYRTSAQMLSDANPAGVMGAFGIMNLSLGLQSTSGRWSVVAFCNNVFNKIYYQDVEDFWSGPWLNPAAGTGTSTVIAQPARDAQRYGGIRVNLNF
jgi:iron complex outermembrane receptor protein